LPIDLGTVSDGRYDGALYDRAQNDPFVVLGWGWRIELIDELDKGGRELWVVLAWPGRSRTISSALR
jgi:hypothetical protein